MSTDGLLTGLYVATGVLMASSAIPMWAEWVPRNRWYGFRTARTLSDERTWYVVNRIAGRDLFYAGIAIALGTLFLFFILERVPYPLHWADIILFTFATGLALLHSFWTLIHS
jgi:hypothetical protein